MAKQPLSFHLLLLVVFLLSVAAKGVHCFQEKKYYNLLSLQWQQHQSGELSSCLSQKSSEYSSLLISSLKKKKGTVHYSHQRKLSNGSQCFNLIYFLTLLLLFFVSLHFGIYNEVQLSLLLLQSRIAFMLYGNNNH